MCLLYSLYFVSCVPYSCLRSVRAAFVFAHYKPENKAAHDKTSVSVCVCVPVDFTAFEEFGSKPGDRGGIYLDKHKKQLFIIKHLKSTLAYSY